jgi:hypothetical protein
MTTTSHNTSPYANPELETSLEKEHEKILEHARLKGIHFAKMMKPSLKGDTLIHYVSEFTSRYERMGIDVRQKVLAENTGLNIRMVSENAQEKISKLIHKQEQVKTEFFNLELQLNQQGITLDDISRIEPNKKFVPVLAVIGIGEVIFNTGAFQAFGDNLLFSFLISLAVTGSLFWLSKLLAQQLKEGSAAGKKRIAIISGAVVLALGSFYMLAKLRSEYLNEQSGFHVSPLLLVFVNILFFAVTTWYFFRNTISPEEKKKQEKLLRYKKQLEELKSEDIRLEQEIDVVRENLALQTRNLLYKPEYVKMLCLKISRWKIEAVEAFKAANLSHRSDRKAPDCFMQSIDPQDHYYQPIKP